MNEKRVKELVKLEIMDMLKPGGLLHALTQPAQVTVAPVSAEERPLRSAEELEVDKVARQVAEDGMGPLAYKIGLRMEAGMSKELALVLAMRDEGFDLTPEAFEVNKMGSYFDKHADPTGGLRAEKFTDTFINKVKDDIPREDAYEQACNEMGLNAVRKTGVFEKVFAELPDKAGGAFQKSLAQARTDIEHSYDSPRRLGAGSLGNAAEDDT